MKTFLLRIPTPMAGLSLGLAALGNLIGDGVPFIREICGTLAAILWILVAIKLLCFPENTCDEFKNPVIASVSATLFMSAMQLAGYAKPFLGNVAFFIWCLALLGHLLLIVWFTINFFTRQFALINVYPSYFVTYVGIIVASVTAPTFHMEALGRLFFWFGFSLYLPLFLLIAFRLYHHPLPFGARPLFCIFTAPMSLSLSGYLSVMEIPSLPFALIMTLFAQGLFCIVITQLPKLLRLPFFPSYAAFTFPFVITAFGLKKFVMLLDGLGYALPITLHGLLTIEILLACILTIYAFVRYMGHLACGLPKLKARFFQECKWCCT